MKQFSMIRIDSVWYAPPISRADEEGGTSWLWREAAAKVPVK
jgi:hypothetical protein